MQQDAALDRAASKREKSVPSAQNDVVVSRRVTLSIPEFVLSTIDSNVEEIFVVTLKGMDLEHQQSIVGASASSIRFVLHSLQIK